MNDHDDQRHALEAAQKALGVCESELDDLGAHIDVIRAVWTAQNALRNAQGLVVMDKYGRLNTRAADAYGFGDNAA